MNFGMQIYANDHSSMCNHTPSSMLQYPTILQLKIHTSMVNFNKLKKNIIFF